ncbi:MAG TPA: hypothetical protein PK624_11705 [Spirochaetota bacterium]|nr:hypothetical protein [Spirochaetota bacterium]HOR45446.1 hypothetical protein [Spirochaetota bacterium]HPK56977.1 hypothetical protein [Spirochaetota bacterium]
MVEIDNIMVKDRGQILFPLVKDLISDIRLRDKYGNDVDRIWQLVKSGTYTFLFDENGEFIKDSMEFF